MTEYLNLETWNRKKLFDFFRTYDNPFFNICAELEISKLLAFTKENQVSFFIASLFLSTKAANAIEPFRYRLRDDRILIHDIIHAGSTVLNDDETFGFCYFDWTPTFSHFELAAKQSLTEYRDTRNKLDPHDDRDNLIHYSVIPWISFRSFSHARRFGTTDSVPKIVFGKYFNDAGAVKLPVSVEVHHSLMDGLHVGRFLQEFQEYANAPEDHLRA
ncbi:chloramphenicol acetyltransferase [bacterium]|nr:chloramphenicol acetyltransferase [bacterium]